MTYWCMSVDGTCSAIDLYGVMVSVVLQMAQSHLTCTQLTTSTTSEDMSGGS